MSCDKGNGCLYTSIVGFLVILCNLYIIRACWWNSKHNIVFDDAAPLELLLHFQVKKMRWVICSAHERDKKVIHDFSLKISREEASWEV